MNTKAVTGLLTLTTSIFTSAIIAILLFAGICQGKELVIDKTTIDRDTIWEGEILIKGDVEVAPGATLTIMPGTVVRFAKIEEFGPQKLFTDKAHHFSRSELFIRGRLYAQGNPNQMITFTSAEKSPGPGDWGSVNFLDSVDNILEYCIFNYGQTAVHCHSAQVIITKNIFQHNGTAIGQKNLKGDPIKCVVPILYNRITDNGGGVLFGGGTTPTISHNEISNNVFFGIYVKKGGPANIRFNNISGNGKGVIFYVVKKVNLRDNNIADNIDYNISLLEGQTGDIMARNNWWGTTDEKGIRKYVMDNSRDKTLGSVDFSDFYKAPVPGAGLLD